MKDISQISDCNFHQLWLQLQYKKLKSLVVCVTYRPPDCPLTCFQSLLKPSYITALAMNKPIIILGDLNCNTLKECPENKALSEILLELNLTQIINDNKPTRITDRSESLIDVILISNPDLVRDSGVINIAISDHLPVFATLKLKPPNLIQLSSKYAVLNITILYCSPLPLLQTPTSCYPYLLKLMSTQS